MAARRTKSTSVRAVRTAMQLLERTWPALGARWVDRIWFTVPASRPAGAPVPDGGAPFELAVGGRIVRGRRWGDSEQIVYLVHGWGSDGAQLGAFVGPLREAGLTVVAYDALSHGSSDPGPSGPRRSNALEQIDALRAVVSAHGPAHGVLAHSLGSMVAAVAMRDGVAPRRAVYVAPTVDVTTYGETLIRMLGAGARIWARLVARIERRLGVPMSAFDLVAIADELATPPLLIIHDRDDRETSCEESRVLADAWPDARLLTTTGLGHNRILTDSAVVSTAVAFLCGHDVTDENLKATAVA
jgi:pimeloyl-ACP methyl ester carboxylesterase